MGLPNASRFKQLVIDVDGVMTTGQFFYSEEGKVMKVFGPDDHDALSLISAYVSISFVTGDRKGFSISKKRIQEDMKFPLDLVSTIQRSQWIRQRFDPREVIYIGDGIFDHYVFKEVGYSIAPANADEFAKASANYVTQRKGGDRAVAEACLHLMEKFFDAYDPNCLPKVGKELSGEWTV